MMLSVDAHVRGRGVEEFAPEAGADPPTATGSAERDEGEGPGDDETDGEKEKAAANGAAETGRGPHPTGDGRSLLMARPVSPGSPAEFANAVRLHRVARPVDGSKLVRHHTYDIINLVTSKRLNWKNGGAAVVARGDERIFETSIAHSIQFNFPHRDHPFKVRSGTGAAPLRRASCHVPSTSLPPLLRRHGGVPARHDGAQLVQEYPVERPLVVPVDQPGVVRVDPRLDRAEGRVDERRGERSGVGGERVDPAPPVPTPPPVLPSSFRRDHTGGTAGYDPGRNDTAARRWGWPFLRTDAAYVLVPSGAGAASAVHECTLALGGDDGSDHHGPQPDRAIDGWTGRGCDRDPPRESRSRIADRACRARRRRRRERRNDEAQASARKGAAPASSSSPPSFPPASPRRAAHGGGGAGRGRPGPGTSSTACPA
ncbi:hypothetical protein THAOC_23958, partial [Thalassiosira oceanica]